MATSRAVDDPDSTRDDVIDDEVDVVDSDCPDGDSGWEPIEPEPSGDHFDAFDASTWQLAAPAAPWYQTRLATWTAIVAGLAAVTLVVSVVLLVFRGSSGADGPPSVDHSPTAVSSTPTATAVLLPPPSDPLPPPPPPPPLPSSVPVNHQANNRPQATPTTHAKRAAVAPPIKVTPVIKATPARTP